MKSTLLKKLIVQIAVFAALTSVMGVARAGVEEYTYSMHLYFTDAQHYEDELTLKVHEDLTVTGHLHVPNDFDADIQSPSLFQERLTFHVTLPPKYDQIFPGGLDYQLIFPLVSQCPPSYCPFLVLKNTFIGFVYSPGGVKYIGSVIGIAKKAKS